LRRVARGPAAPDALLLERLPSVRVEATEDELDVTDAGRLTVRDLARMLDEAMRRDNGYQTTPLGREVARFLRYLRTTRDATPRTVEDYESILARFVGDHAHLELAAFGGVEGSERVVDFVARRWEHAAAGTRRKAFAVLSSFFDWAVRFERVDSNPVRRLDRPRRRGVERHAHSPERIRRIIDAQPDLRDRVAIALMARLGLRKSELRLLRWRDVDLDAAELRVQAKGGKRPVIPIPHADLLADLAELRQDADPDHYLLHPVRTPNLPRLTRVVPYPDRPMQASTMHRWWARCLAHASAAHFPMHELRHSAVTEFLRANGGDLALARRFARHASVSTTVDVYGHLETDELIRGMHRTAERWAAAK
jgi:integrase